MNEKPLKTKEGLLDKLYDIRGFFMTFVVS